MWQEKPVLLHIGAILSAAAMILWLQIRPYGVLFTLILAFWVYKTRCPSFTIVPPPTLSNKFEITYKKFIQLRQEKPRMCCIIVSAGLAALAVLGHIVSGSSIVVFGLLVATLIFSRHKLIIVTEIREDDNAWSSTDHDVDEFLPEVNESNLFVLQNAGEKAVLLLSQQNDEEDKSDEIPLDLIIADSIPEIEEHSDSSDDDCLISPAAALQTTQTIEFKSGYFNRDTSSSDEDSITKGLNFQNYSLTDSSQGPQQNTKNAPAAQPNSQTSMFPIPNLVSGLMTWGVENLISKQIADAAPQLVKRQNPPPPDKQRQPDSSDESEFEILNSDELNQAS